MLDMIFSLFKAIYQGIATILNLITSIPKYTAAVINLITALIPGEVLIIIMVAITAYIIIHVKRLVL